MAQFTFNKKDRLKSTKQIDLLFAEGKSINEFPLKLFYNKTTFDGDIMVKAAVSVSKRNFKKAVDRNRIKRLLRESYRLHKPHYFNNSTTSYALMFLYLGKEMPSFETINTKMEQLLTKFSEKDSEH